MAFKLGNYSVKEVIYGIAEDFSGNLLYVLDQLTNAQIEVSSDPTEITDKRGNVIRQVYNNKTATLTATSALASVPLLNASSGSPIQTATDAAPIEMPKIVQVAAGSTVDVTDAKEGTIHVMGLYNNGANSVQLSEGVSAVVDKTYAYDASNHTITVPAAGTDNPSLYVIKYDRDVTNGLKLSNSATDFPTTVKLTFYIALMDPCSDKYRAGWLVIDSFTPDPSVTIGFDAENQEVDFTGSINVSFCSDQKNLYSIYFADEEAVLSGVTE